MASLTGLDLKNTKANDFDVIPAGDYPAIITKSESKPTKDGTGERLNLQLQILDGKFQNRTLFDGLNVKNKSAMCQQIGRGQLKAICIAVNVPDPDDSSELHNKPLMISVKVGSDDKGNPRNEIKGYKARLTTAAKPPVVAAVAGPNMIEQAFEETAVPTKKNPFV